MHYSPFDPSQSGFADCMVVLGANSAMWDASVADGIKAHLNPLLSRPKVITLATLRRVPRRLCLPHVASYRPRDGSSKVMIAGHKT